jgi:hypothetical protein
MPPRYSPNDEPDKLDSEPKTAPTQQATAAPGHQGQQVTPPEDEDSPPAE